MRDCHCGRDGHPLHSVNCPVHGREAQYAAAKAALIAINDDARFEGDFDKWSRAALDAAAWVRG